MNSMLSFSVMFSNIPVMIKVRALCQILEASQDWLTGQVRGVHVLTNFPSDCFKNFRE